MSITRSDSPTFTEPSRGLAKEPWPEGSGFEIVGYSAEIKRLRLQVRRIGPHFRTVLISGEAGTGKEQVARALHGMSHVADGPFVMCHGAVLEEAVSEHLKENADALGCLTKMAHRGTLFLHGIHEMPLQTQLSLLRLLRRHDSTQNHVQNQMDPCKLDLRMIAATSENLKILASAGRFQQELYRSKVSTIADEAMERMLNYSWPGNVRELKAAVRSSLSRVEGDVLESHHLPPLVEDVPSSTEDGIAESARLQDVVEQHVLRVLKECGGNKVRAAEVLGISRSTLYRMLDASASAVLQ
jgi:DNA-binding NtrC family response regulator